MAAAGAGRAVRLRHSVTELPRQPTARTVRSPALPVGTPSLPHAGSRPGGRHRISPALIGWAVAGGFAAACTIVAGVIVANRPAPFAISPSPILPTVFGPTIVEWNKPFVIEKDGATFVATFYRIDISMHCVFASGDPVELAIYYSYKNLGPREGMLIFESQTITAKLDDGRRGLLRRFLHLLVKTGLKIYTP